MRRPRCQDPAPCWQVRLNTFAASPKFFIIRTALTRDEARAFVDAQVLYFSSHDLITYYLSLDGKR